MTDFDIIIKGGTIVDGTRTPRYVSDLAIKNGKIAQIGGLKGKTADRILDAASPGNGEEGSLGLLLYRNFEFLALRVDSKGTVKQSVPLNAANVKPTRDPRAQLTTRGNSVSVELPGKRRTGRDGHITTGPLQARSRAFAPVVEARR